MMMMSLTFPSHALWKKTHHYHEKHNQTSLSYFIRIFVDSGNLAYGSIIFDRNAILMSGWKDWIEYNALMRDLLSSFIFQWKIGCVICLHPSLPVCPFGKIHSFEIHLFREERRWQGLSLLLDFLCSGNVVKVKRKKSFPWYRVILNTDADYYMLYMLISVRESDLRGRGMLCKRRSDSLNIIQVMTQSC